MKRSQCLIALALGLGLALGLLWLLGSQNSVALAGPGILYVAPGGDCGGATPCYVTVQAAVDAASAGDEIRVAEGTYTGVSARAEVTQMVYISKTVAVRGGYTTANWTTPNPAANLTTLDAQGLGRVLYITGDINPTVEGLRITGGDATGLGGGAWGDDAGGGVYVYEATATISNCVVYSNTASVSEEGHGGGLYLGNSAATLEGNTVQGNTASTAWVGAGGGLYLYDSDNATLEGNTVQGNTASTASSGFGGGLHLVVSAATLEGNTVQGNTASTASSGSGGGLYLWRSAATLSGNTVVSNTATLNPLYTGRGGGLWVRYSSFFTLTNNLVAGNQANTEGSGLWFGGASWGPIAGRLLHTTIADNGSTGLTAGRSSGQGVFVGGYTTLAFTNTIISGHTVGITVTQGNTATLNATLWRGNTINWGGGGTINHSNDHSGDPAFVNPAGGDYHIGATSAAIDQGVDAGVTTDIDGDTRPWGEGYDIGADEFRQRYIYLPLVLKKHN